MAQKIITVPTIVSIEDSKLHKFDKTNRWDREKRVAYVDETVTYWYVNSEDGTGEARQAIAHNETHALILNRQVVEVDEEVKE